MSEIHLDQDSSSQSNSNGEEEKSSSDSLHFANDQEVTPSGSPISKSTNLSGLSFGSPIIDPNVPVSVITVINSRISQMKSLTSPSDLEQIQLLDSIQKVSYENVSTKLATFLDFIITRLSNLTLDMAVLKNDVKQTKEELRISENRSTRLLMHLQQNVKIMTRIATNDNETTLVQEANKNLQRVMSMENYELPSQKTYIKQLKSVFQQRRDSKLTIEALELLKQELSINILMRKQTDSLNQASTKIQDTIDAMRKEIVNKEETVKAETKQLIEKLKKENEEKQATIEETNLYLGQIAQIMGVSNPSQVLVDLPKIKQASVLLQRDNQQLKAKCEESTNKLKALEKKARKLEDENKTMKDALNNVNQKRETNIERARKRLFESLGEEEEKRILKDYKGKNEIDLLVYGTNASIKIITEQRKCKSLLKVQDGELLQKVINMVEENQGLKNLAERNQAILSKQTLTLHELQNQLEEQKVKVEQYPKPNESLSQISPIKKNYNSSIQQESSSKSISLSIHNDNENAEDNESDNDDVLNDDDLEMSLESINHMNELDNLKAEFSTIGHELEQLQTMMKFKPK